MAFSFSAVTANGVAYCCVDAGWFNWPWPDTEGVLVDGDLSDIVRCIGPPDGRGDEVRCVGVAPGFGLEDGVAIALRYVVPIGETWVDIMVGNYQ
jgi:hypothetical protein